MASATLQTERLSTHTSERVLALDGLRGLAILMVLAVHLQDMNVLPARVAILHRLSWVFSWGWAGVDLFFVLSGFLITGILLDTKESAKRASSFYARRILRIFPIYYLTLTGCCIAYALLCHRSRWVLNMLPSNLGFVSYFFYAQNWWMVFKELQHLPVLGHFWSLAVEEQFYLLWPWFVWRLPKSKLLSVCAAGFLIALILRWFCMTSLDELFWFVYMNTFTRMDTLLAGAFCAIAIRDARTMSWVRRLGPTSWALAATCFLLIMIRSRYQWQAMWHYIMTIGYSCTAVVFAGLVLTVYLQHWNDGPLAVVFRHKSLVTFGKYSYGIYVYQGIIENAGYHFLSRYPWWGRSLRAGALISLAWIAIPFGTAVLSYRFIEKPFLNLKRKFRA